MLLYKKSVKFICYCTAKLLYLLAPDFKFWGVKLKLKFDLKYFKPSLQCLVTQSFLANYSHLVDKLCS